MRTRRDPVLAAMPAIRNNSPAGQLAQRILEKGGLYVLAAKECQRSDALCNQFINECFDQCHHNSAFELWGAELVMDIIHYKLKMLREEMKKIMASKSPLNTSIPVEVAV